MVLQKVDGWERVKVFEDTNSLVCKKCGNELVEGDNYCIKCGKEYKSQKNEFTFPLAQTSDEFLSTIYIEGKVYSSMYTVKDSDEQVILKAIIETNRKSQVLFMLLAALGI